MHYRIYFVFEIILCIVLCCVKSQQEILLEESSSIQTLQAGVGGLVELPCDVTPTLPNDSMGLVIWYKQGHETPIYTYDKREGVTSHWSDPSTLSTRATFRTNTEPAVLQLIKLRAEDDGQYRCRVDFIRSPTKNTRLNLTVLIPPERLLILDQEGVEIRGGVLGPYDEGTDVNLTCVAVGGRPTARVSWWKSHVLLANSEARAAVSFSLQRNDYASEITCQAVTDPSLSPVSETLTIKVNLRPLWVRLLGGKRPLVAERRAELACQAVGARPPPNISWWKDTTKLTSVRGTTSPDGNITTSTLSFVPKIEDAGKVLSCRAVQPGLLHAIREDGFQLEIQYTPIVKLQLGTHLDAKFVEEGFDIYLECMVRANPRHTHVHFVHNGTVLSNGDYVVIVNQSLVLQRLSRRTAGAYMCVARNELGESYSQPLVLDVRYRPICKSEKTVTIRAGRGETVEIVCDLDSNPKEPITYKWWFNNTTHSKIELNNMIAQEQSNLGIYYYTVNTSTDYGWVQCAGTNEVGHQYENCYFQITPAEKPSPVKNCDISNVTLESLKLTCEPGHDGGLKQAFVLQVFDTATGTLLRNISSEEPQFAVWGLSGDVAMTIYPYNSKGPSEPFSISSSLLKHPQRRTATLPIRVELTTILVTLLYAIGGIAAIFIVFAFVFCWKYCNKNNDKNEKRRKKDKIMNTPLTDSKECESVDSLDKNPDIIPIERKISDNCSTKSSTADCSSIRPLLSKTDPEQYDSQYIRRYDHNYSQYIQVPPLDFRVHQYGLNMPNIGSNIHSFRPTMPDVGDCLAPHDKVHENWLKYKNSLPLNTNGLLPMEQYMPSELYPAYGTIRNPNSSKQKSELESYLNPPSFIQEYRGASPIRVNADNSVYYTKNLLQGTGTGSCTQLNTSLPVMQSNDTTSHNVKESGFR